MMLMGTVLAAWRAQRWALAIMTTTAAVSAALNLLWIPRLGAMASANVAVITYSGAAVAMAVVLVLLPSAGRERR
jgi:hypothetical protein